MQKQAERFGARIQFGTIEAVNLSKEPFTLNVDGETLETETLIIASGASHRHLGLESEEKLERKGVTYCATCDGALPLFRNQPLIVVGGETRLAKKRCILPALAPRFIWSIGAIPSAPRRSWPSAPLPTPKSNRSGIR